MKDWRRSPEPPGMMGLKDAAYQVQGNWGQPEELAHSDFDPASPLPPTTPAVFLATDGRPPRTLTQPRRTDGLSLYTMCLRVILRNISSVQDLGDMPYRNAKPILEECRIDQLILLEEASPHLLEHTDEIWKRNCLRDFIELRKKYQPLAPASTTTTTTTAAAKEPKSWRRLYFRTKGEIEQAKVEAAQRIKDKYAQHRAEKDAKKLVVSDRPLMLKAARSGGRRFGITAGAGGASKGQSLMNKARSGSAAQAKLTAPRNGRFGFKTQGRSKAVGAEIAPEAAGIEARQMVRPMVAPRRITAGGSEGLARMKEFSRPAPSEEGKSTAAASTSRKAVEAGDAASRKQTVDFAAEATGLPRLKPHEVAAAPPLTPASSSSGITSRSKSAHGHPTGSISSSSPYSAEASSRRQPASPPPDIARTERRKLNFFSGAKPSSAATTPSSTSSSFRAASPLSPSTSGVQVRGVKRAHCSSSQAAEATSSRSVPTSNCSVKTVTSPSASSPTATSLFASGGKSGGVRVVQSKRARVQEAVPRSSPSAAGISASGKDNEEPRSSRSSAAGGARPSPVQKHSSSAAHTDSVRAIRVSGKNERTARASPAAMSSVFAPSRSSPSKGRSESGVSR